LNFRFQSKKIIEITKPYKNDVFSEIRCLETPNLSEVISPKKEQLDFLCQCPPLPKKKYQHFSKSLFCPQQAKSMFFESPALKNQNINFFKIGFKQISYSFPKPND